MQGTKKKVATLIEQPKGQNHLSEICRNGAEETEWHREEEGGR